jgi:hypothetical protein
MAYPIFPVSPLPAGLTRQFHWKTDEALYDSGASTGMTTFQRPLYRYSIPFINYNEIKQGPLAAFFNVVKGKTLPFLMKDPYDYRVNSVMGVRSGYASGSGDLRLYDTNSYQVRADTTTIGSLFSSLSGWVTLGAEYSYSQDTGLLTVNTKAQNDVWGVRSMQYWRKVKFTNDYTESAVIWNIFGSQIDMREEV